MPTDVIMPQMGESIFEGTITKWLKKPGDRVERDEPLFEISTDKVDAEIPSPASGILKEIKTGEGSTVQINTVVGVIADGDEKSASETAPAAVNQPAPSTPEAPKAAPPKPAKSEPETPQTELAGKPASAPTAQAPPASATDVVMPQMGESIFEGTITKWLKNPGDSVEKDEPLFEISTDKVDAEIPSPESGVLAEVRTPAGSTVAINTVVAVIHAAGGAAAAPSKEAGAETPPPPVQPTAAAGQEAESEAEPEAESATGAGAGAGAGERVRSSPLVRRIAKENNLDLRRVPPTGTGGRVTKEDILGFLAKGGESAQAPPATTAPVGQVGQVGQAGQAGQAAPATTAPAAAAGAVQAGDQLVPMSRMRSIIAQRMVESKHTSAHVHTCFKIDMSRIVRLREKEKSKYEQRNGVKLTYMPFLSRAVVVTLRKMPIVNASMEGSSIRYHKSVNLGIAVALDWGLIVPVIRQAEELNFLGIARAIANLAERARSKKLKPEEVGSGTFTITNPGIFGEQFGTPVINQPEAAILGVGGLFKEPAVVTDENGFDSIAIRSVIRLTLGFDHRIIDGADAGKFMAEVKKYLENWNEDIG